MVRRMVTWYHVGQRLVCGLVSRARDHIKSKKELERLAPESRRRRAGKGQSGASSKVGGAGLRRATSDGTGDFIGRPGIGAGAETGAGAEISADVAVIRHQGKRQADSRIRGMPCPPLATSQQRDTTELAKGGG